MEFIDACRKFIEIDSTPSNGTLEIAQFAAELCRSAGLHVDLQEDTFNGIGQANLIARPVAGRPQDEFLLQTHLDTVDPGSFALWTKTGANPFSASIYQDTIYGLGAAKSKLDFLCKLEAIRQLGPRKWRHPFALAGTFGEEQGMAGSIRLIRKKAVSAREALIGGPTELSIHGAGKGYAGVEVEVPFSDEEKRFRIQHDTGSGAMTQSRVFVGKAAHSSSPQSGESAILKLFDYLMKLPEGLAVMEIEGGTSYNTVPGHAVLEIDMVGDLRESIASKISKIVKATSEVEKKFAGYPDSEFDPPFPTLNIGLVRTFEDYVKIGGCCRLPPTVTDQVYQGWMEILRTACEEVGATFRITNYKQPFRTPADSPLIKICREELEKQGRSGRCGAQSAANDANVLSRFGIQCVVFGPGQGVGNSHGPDEHVKIADLHEATRFYKGVLERVCL